MREEGGRRRGEGWGMVGVALPLAAPCEDGDESVHALSGSKMCRVCGQFMLTPAPKACTPASVCSNSE